MSSPLSVLVTGATGNQGGAVAEHLLRAGHTVRALVRERRSRRAQRIEVLGAELVEGDYDEPDSIVAAARGMHGMFALATPFERGVQAEWRQGRTLIDGARRAGVQHIVYSSVASADRHTGIPHFESKHRVEQHLEKSGVPYTVVGPSAFRENYLGRLDDITFHGVLSMPLLPDKALQTLCRDDLGAFVTHVFEAGAALQGRRFDLASDELTGPAMASAFERALGRPVAYQTQDLDVIMNSDDDMSRMWAWLNRAGYSVDIARMRRDFPEVPWKSFEEWVRDLLSERPQPAA
jgi:uncharacterized protein YbjT (DUF2867 family)